MSEHPDQENANIREINNVDDPSENETTAKTDAREAREAMADARTRVSESRQCDTPRTDAEDDRGDCSVRVSLERELAAVTAERDKALRGRCDKCGANIINDCSTCGAPQCCPQCCKIYEQQREIARLKDELRRGGHAEMVYLSTNERLMTDHDALAAKLAEAQKDTERLDAIIENGWKLTYYPETSNWWCGDTAKNKTPRAAIDDALAKAGEGKA